MLKDDKGYIKKKSEAAAQVENHVQVCARVDFVLFLSGVVVEPFALENEVDLRFGNAFSFLERKFELSDLDHVITVSSSSTFKGIVFPVNSRILICIMDK